MDMRKLLCAGLIAALAAPVLSQRGPQAPNTPDPSKAENPAPQRGEAARPMNVPGAANGGLSRFGGPPRFPSAQPATQPITQPAPQQSPPAATPQAVTAPTATAAQGGMNAAQLPQRPPSVPPSPARVSYAGGELTIVANNSSLPEILNSLRSLMGVKVEGANYASAERVFGQFGPGNPRQVLNSLLSGAKFDFILAGSLDNPYSVNHVILSPHVTGSPGSQMAQAGQQQAQPQEEIQQEDTNEDTPEQPEQQQPAQNPQGNQPAPSETISPQPAGLAAPTGQQQVQPQGQQVPGQQQQQGQPRTPEQLLEELKRLQQQQQQQQQQQVPK